jgi:effector-binding domain-containing protein
MTYLSWDEGGPCVLAYRNFVTRLADVKPGHASRGATLNKAKGEYRMNFISSFRLTLIALVPAAAISLGVGNALAQSPPAAAPPVASTPATPAPAPSATPAPAPTATPAPETSPSATPPAAAETPATPPAAAAPVQTADPFGEEITLEPKTVVILRGNATWDSAFDTLIESFKSLSGLLDKQGIQRAGNPMIVYTATDDTGFTYLAEIPVDQDPKNLAKDMSIGKSPEGKALKFVHRGSYDNMDNTYEAITNHLDDKKLEAKDTFVEEYMTDPLKTEEDQLVINVYVPLK